jgi:hypothetical protein
MKRLCLEGIRALEIWDAPVDGRTLFEWQPCADFPAALLAVVRSLRGEHGFAHLHLLGGGAARGDLLPALAALGEEVGVSRAADPQFAAARAGSALVAGGACADVGQTAIKLVRGERSALVPRDLSRAPLRDQAGPEALLSTRAFFAEVLRPAPRLLALPCAVGDSGALGGCSYRFDEAAFAHLPEKTLLVNDAELAALAAARDPAVPRSGATLVLTLGFGVGAALLSPGRAALALERPAAR